MEDSVGIGLGTRAAARAVRWRHGGALPRPAWAAALACAAAGVTAPAAQAASVGYADGRIVFLAGAGETNAVTVEKGADAFTFTDSGVATISPASAQCLNVLPNVVKCLLGDRGAQTVELRLGDGDDNATMQRAPAIAEGAVVPYGFLHAYGGAGDDTVETTEFADLHGEEGGDTLLGTGVAHVDGGAGDDTLRGLVAVGGDGDDEITATGFQGRVEPGAGADTIYSGDAVQARLTYAGETTPVAVSIDGLPNDGPDGRDLIGDGFELIIGGSAADRFEGGPGADGFLGGGGDDVLHGSGGDDWLGGGDGDDLLFGGEGDDALLGNSGGRDVMEGGPGADVMGGGSPDGHEVVSYAGRTTPVNVTNERWVFLNADREGDDGAAGERDHVIGAEEIVGGAAADVLIGFAGADVLVGGFGQDVLDGAGGADTIVSRDRLRDTVTCGDDADAVSADGRDVVAADCESVRYGGAVPG